MTDVASDLRKPGVFHARGGEMSRKKAPARKKTGRRTKYDPDTHPQRARELAEAGMLDRELAEAFGIDRATLYRWQNRYRDFCDALKGGKLKPNCAVHAALYKRCLGYEYDSQVVTGIRPKFSKGPIRVVRVVSKKIHVPADTTCLIFWLKNRKPEQWRVSSSRHVFNRLDGLEGITPEAEAEVAAAVERILEGCPVCREREEREKAKRDADRKGRRPVEESGEPGIQTPPRPKESIPGPYVCDVRTFSPASIAQNGGNGRNGGNGENGENGEEGAGDEEGHVEEREHDYAVLPASPGET